MKFSVIVLPEAEADLLEIYLYVARNDSLSRADTLLDNIENTCAGLNHSPERGHEVSELKRVHVAGFREIHFKPYRVIYQIVQNTVHIHAVLDGRRELQELLELRLLRS
jgi:toxin ParE1/3/4